MLPVPRFKGPYRRECRKICVRTVAHAVARRLLHGAKRKSWNWTVEIGTAVIREQLIAAFQQPTAEEQRKFLDCMVLASPLPKKFTREEVVESNFRGTWFLPEKPADRTLLYLHGGGFAVYPKDSYAEFISLIALAANARTFALDYRLAPEHPFPAALEDARRAYLCLLEQNVDPKRIAIGGDSAGGNMTLSLLPQLRDAGIPLPALGIALSPATEFDEERASLHHDEADWITGRMAETWRDWYCREEERANPRVSPIHADLRGLPSIYIQAGRAEILYDSIAAFAAKAAIQQADVRLETWDDMNHVFQFFGYNAPQSTAALQRITEVIEQYLPQAELVPQSAD